MTGNRGEIAIKLLKARIADGTFADAGVEDTPRNRALWAEIGRDIDNLPPGVVPAIPADYTDQPGD